MSTSLVIAVPLFFCRAAPAASTAAPGGGEHACSAPRGRAGDPGSCKRARSRRPHETSCAGAIPGRTTTSSRAPGRGSRGSDAPPPTRPGSQSFFPFSWTRPAAPPAFVQQMDMVALSELLARSGRGPSPDRRASTSKGARHRSRHGHDAGRASAVDASLTTRSSTGDGAFPPPRRRPRDPAGARREHIIGGEQNEAYVPRHMPQGTPRAILRRFSRPSRTVPMRLCASSRRASALRPAPFGTQPLCPASRRTRPSRVPSLACLPERRRARPHRRIVHRRSPGRAGAALADASRPATLLWIQVPIQGLTCSSRRRWVWL